MVLGSLVSREAHVLEEDVAATAVGPAVVRTAAHVVLPDSDHRPGRLLAVDQCGRPGVVVDIRRTVKSGVEGWDPHADESLRTDSAFSVQCNMCILQAEGSS